MTEKELYKAIKRELLEEREKRWRLDAKNLEWRSWKGLGKK